MRRPLRTTGTKTLATVGACLGVLVLGGCTAAPPPPVESTESPSATPVPGGGGALVVGIDGIGPGFNPHLLANQSPATALLGDLLLPSPFRLTTVDGTPRRVMDPALLVSAEVTNTAPFTVTYVLRNEASWSDSAPIAAEDFRFLWQQMIAEPGTVDPTGYRAIRDVRSLAGGKTVQVEFAQPYAPWQELFADLLPAHLVKDAPGGFESGLTDSLSVSGSLFRIKSVDRGREEVLLERNDRFWGKPAAADRILLRRAGGVGQLADSLRTGDTQYAQVAETATVAAQLGAIPSVTTSTGYGARGLVLTLNGRRPALADARVREAVLGALDVKLLAQVASGRSDVNPVASQVYWPSDQGYGASGWAGRDGGSVAALLTAAGYVRSAAAPQTGAASTTTAPPQPTNTVDAPWYRGVDPLRLTIGVVADDGIAAAVAATAADELRGAGIDARVRSVRPDVLFGDGLTSLANADDPVDAVLHWQQVGDDPASRTLATFGCSASLTTTAEAQQQVADAPSNLSGVCDEGITTELARAVAGGADPAALRDIDRRLWALASNLPIVQERITAALGPSAGGIDLSDAGLAGPVSSAATWRRLY